MSENVLPNPLNVNVISPDPLPVDIVSPDPLNVNIVSPDPLPVDPVPKDYYLEVLRGNVTGQQIVLMQGSNPDVDLAAAENLWDIGGILVYATANEQWAIRSSDANDTLLGTGAQQVTVTYLDDLYVEQTEIVDLNGTTSSSLPVANGFRAISAKVTSVGSGGQNAGTITIRVQGGGDQRIGIEIGANRSLHGFYTVPAGKTAYVIYAFSTIAKGKDATVDVKVTQGDDGIFFRQVPSEIYQNSITISPVAPFGPLIEKTDINFLCTTENNNTRVNSTLQLLVIDD